MATTQPTKVLNPFKGPEDKDPLTSKELMILLAIPRAAQTSPSNTAFRLPLGPHPAQGWIDVNFSETRSIVSRLASSWRARLNAVWSKTSNGSSSIGPGTTICVLVQPAVNSIFHHLAFGALGCTIQYVSLALEDDTICAILRESQSSVVLYSGIDGTRVTALKDRFEGDFIALPEDEFACVLAREEKTGHAEPAPPWPEPQRPIPSLILHSSGSTGIPKLIRFSLFWYTLFFPTDDVKIISAAYLSGTAHSGPKSPHTHPQLIFSPPFWQSYHLSLLVHLITATPVTFGYFDDGANLPSNQLIPWARALDVGSIICSPRFLREMSAEEFQAQAEFLASLNSITVGGGPVDRSMSALFEKHRLPIANYYGTSEYIGGLSAKRPPYSHLRPGPTGSPLVLPISEPDADGSRQVQLWHALSTSPHVAHFYARGGASIKFEPFPGEGPHKGEIAVNTNDIFQEVPDEESGVSYIFLGRADDMIRLVGYADMNASQFEIEFTSTINARWKEGSERGWILDAVQLFGNNLPYTALVVQFCSSGQGGTTLGEELLDDLCDAVEQVNHKLVPGPLRVDPKKRMLVITSEGGVYGPNAASARGLRLEVTHKHSLQRWKNVQAFDTWLRELGDDNELGMT